MSNVEKVMEPNPFDVNMLEFLQVIEDGGVSLNEDAQRLAVAMIFATEDDTMNDEQMTFFLSMFMLTTQEFKAFKKQRKPEARLKYTLAKMRMDAFNKGFMMATTMAHEVMKRD